MVELIKCNHENCKKCIGRTRLGECLILQTASSKEPCPFYKTKEAYVKELEKYNITGCSLLLEKGGN